MKAPRPPVRFLDRYIRAANAVGWVLADCVDYAPHLLPIAGKIRQQLSAAGEAWNRGEWREFETHCRLARLHVAALLEAKPNRRMVRGLQYLRKRLKAPLPSESLDVSKLARLDLRPTERSLDS